MLNAPQQELIQFNNQLNIGYLNKSVSASRFLHFFQSK